MFDHRLFNSKNICFYKTGYESERMILIFHRIMSGENCINFKGVKLSRDTPIHLCNVSGLPERDDF